MFDYIQSPITWSFWRHIFLSKKTYAYFFQALGVLFTLAQIAAFFNIIDASHQSPLTLSVMLILSAAWGLRARLPVSRISYKVPSKDYAIDVRIGDVLDCPSAVVISTNTTFDTDIAGGTIAADSLQGAFTARYFHNDVTDLDRQLTNSLGIYDPQPVQGRGKQLKYTLGTVAKVSAGGKLFYMLAMANLNEHGNARLDERDFHTVLHGLWTFLKDHGELGDVHIPIIGSGRGRIQIPRQKLIEQIAQSFADASRDIKIANKLVIVVPQRDVDEHSLNLFQIRDYLALSLHT